MYYVHKYEEALAYGGPEEGGWYYNTGVPTGFTLGPIEDEEDSYEQCRNLNKLEYERREREEDYPITSVLAYRSTFYTYTVSTDPVAKPYPQVRPHYE